MNQLSHEELCLLEQLTYLDEEVAAAAGVNDAFGKINEIMKGRKISEILAPFLADDALLRLASHR